MDPLPPRLAALPPPPPLRPALVAPELPVLVAIAAWLALTVTLGTATLLGDRPIDVWFWTSVCGWLLGGLGYSVMMWQRSAARRGSRIAQTGLT